jgi:N-acetylmuramoyl-L-alanine amidase
MPAILVEIGYLTNPAERARLQTDAYMQCVADGIVEGIESYKTKLATAGL